MLLLSMDTNYILEYPWIIYIEPFNVFAQVCSLVSFITSYSSHGPIQSSEYVRRKMYKKQIQKRHECHELK